MDRYKVLSIKDFVDFCSESLRITERPQIYFTEDRSWALQRRSFGEYNPGELSVTVYVGNRNTADIIRTLAHEMVHHRQSELGMIRPGSGQTGTKIEDQANALAGILLREYGKMNELIYERRKSHTPKHILIEAIRVKLYGHHRYTAAKRAGLESINAIVVPEKNITLLERVDVPIIDNIENEIFSAYNGRYIFNVTKAYDYIKKGKVKYTVEKISSNRLHFFSHPEFSYTDPNKVKKLTIDYEKPIGVLVKFKNPESEKTEWMLIDGNHRARKASQEDAEAKLYVISDPQEVEKFMKVDTSKPHSLFVDDED